MLWGGEQLFGGKKATGRGMLTPSGIYVPVDGQIYKFNPSPEGSSAELMNTVSVDLGTGAPVGNLFSDGKRIWVNGGNRFYGLWPESDR